MKVKALAYLMIESTNPSEWLPFMENVLGLMKAPNMVSTEYEIFFKMDAYTWRVRVYKGEQDCLANAGWELEDKSSFDEAVRELKVNNVEFNFLSNDECNKRKIREGISLKDPDGNIVELFYFMKLDYLRVNSPANVKEFETGYNGNMGLGHFVIPSPNFSASYQFYTEILGFLSTDYMHFNFNPDPDDSGQGLHFLHVDNPRHHSLAIFEDNNPPTSKCVHLMFEVKDIDEVGYFIDRCKQNDVAIVSTLGKHTNDLMMSVYVASPAGFAIEFGCDGVQLDWSDYQPTESSLPSLWGHEWARPPA